MMAPASSAAATYPIRLSASNSGSGPDAAM